MGWRRTSTFSRDIAYSDSPPGLGIVLVAVVDELMIAHPTDDLHAAGALRRPRRTRSLPGRADCGRRQDRPRAEPLASGRRRCAACRVPLAAGASGLLVSALLTGLLSLLVVAEQLRDEQS